MDIEDLTSFVAGLVRRLRLRRARPVLTFTTITVMMVVSNANPLSRAGGGFGRGFAPAARVVLWWCARVASHGSPLRG